MKQIDLRDERDAIVSLLSSMSKEIVESCSDPRDKGFFEGVYDQAIALVNDLPVWHEECGE